jgi:uncharacterized protein (DUF305 family)
MDTKTILTGLVGVIIGGLIVSVAAGQTPAISNTAMNHQASNLVGKTGDDFDKAFLSEMISHHQGAVEMAKLSESSAKHEEIKKLSRDILATQSKEIDMMQSWQGEWGYKAVDTSHSMH